MSWFKGAAIAALGLWFLNMVAMADTVFVSSETSTSTGGIFRVDPTIGGLIPVTNLAGPDQGICGSDGNLYFAEVGRHRLIRIAQDGRQITQVAKLPGRDDDWHSAPDGPSFDG